jgi:hypothetical protein
MDTNHHRQRYRNKHSVVDTHERLNRDIYSYFNRDNCPNVDAHQASHSYSATNIDTDQGTNDRADRYSDDDRYASTDASGNGYSSSIRT